MKFGTCDRYLLICNGNYDSFLARQADGSAFPVEVFIWILFSLIQKVRHYESDHLSVSSVAIFGRYEGLCKFLSERKN